MTKPNDVDGCFDASNCSTSLQHWGVDVRVNGQDVLTIESNCLFGKSDLSDMELEAIRTAAKHLLAFAGESEKCHTFVDITESTPSVADECGTQAEQTASGSARSSQHAAGI